MQQQSATLPGAGKIVLRDVLIFGLMQVAIHAIVVLSNIFLNSANVALEFILNGLSKCSSIVVSVPVKMEKYPGKYG